MNQQTTGDERFWSGIAAMVACGLLAILVWIWIGLVSVATSPVLCENNVDTCADSRRTLIFFVPAAVLITAAPFLIGFDHWRHAAWALVAAAPLVALGFFAL